MNLWVPNYGFLPFFLELLNDLTHAPNPTLHSKHTSEDLQQLTTDLFLGEFFI